MKFGVPDTPHGSKLKSVRMRVGGNINKGLCIRIFLYRNAAGLQDKDKFRSYDSDSVTRYTSSNDVEVFMYVRYITVVPAKNASAVSHISLIYEGHLESKERFAIQRYLLIIGKIKNMQVL